MNQFNNLVLVWMLKSAVQLSSHGYIYDIFCFLKYYVRFFFPDYQQAVLGILEAT
jgi:hypothetical protein